MDRLSSKLEYELKALYDAYTRGSQGLIYIPTAEEGTWPKKSFIRLKRLVAKNMALYICETLGKPVYAITTEGIQYIHANMPSQKRRHKS